MIVSDLLKASLRKINVFSIGEVPEPEELVNALSALQSMLRAWSADNLLVFSSVKDSFALTPATYLYTWGTGGTFNSGRPNNILGASIVDSGGISHGVDIISEIKYRNISVKGTSSRPSSLYLQPSYPFANVYLYPVPVEIETLNTDSLKPFTETSSFSGLSDVIQFPAYYEEAIIYSLAIRCAPEYGKKITEGIASIANLSYNRLAITNIANKIEPVNLLIPINRNSGYSINTDSYK